MSHLTYYNYEGVGKTNNKEYSYSQAVRVGNSIKCSGQGGWDNQGNIDKEDLKGQIDLAFKNVEKNLKDAGARGWADVHSVRSHHISLSGSFDLMVEQFRKWMPDHQPTWTCVGVTELGIPGMIVEIEVEANIQQAAEKVITSPYLTSFWTTIRALYERAATGPSPLSDYERHKLSQWPSQ
ncbi:L-PSP endoribonuclease family [Fusarium mundagurra]|uniref:L-PSP endoribonuclease family n=1 Tax=Fusarium mundagurra TaxID=1567541 RepID=A0A8H5Y681_9HYPO|nr:L-PSP endoribonuclease family [Fusarium mundagurra]